MKKFDIVKVNDKHHPWIVETLTEHWASVRVVTRGQVYQADRLPGFIAIDGNRPVGLITFIIKDESCEIVTLNSLEEGIGVGSTLIEAVKEEALKAGCKRLWLITTNDNLKAIRFYQRRGFLLAALHKDAITESRRLKPEIPLLGIDGIPIRDEIELEMFL